MRFRTWLILAIGGGYLIYLTATNQITLTNQMLVSSATIIGVYAMDMYINTKKKRSK